VEVVTPIVVAESVPDVDVEFVAPSAGAEVVKPFIETVARSISAELNNVSASGVAIGVVDVRVMDAVDAVVSCGMDEVGEGILEKGDEAVDVASVVDDDAVVEGDVRGVIEAMLNRSPGEV